MAHLQSNRFFSFRLSVCLSFCVWICVRTTTTNKNYLHLHWLCDGDGDGIQGGAHKGRWWCIGVIGVASVLLYLSYFVSKGINVSVFLLPSFHHFQKKKEKRKTDKKKTPCFVHTKPDPSFILLLLSLPLACTLVDPRHSRFSHKPSTTDGWRKRKKQSKITFPSPTPSLYACAHIVEAE